ncbi:MAG TPA: lysozyme inhibitor LprI family protein [Chthoniobacterales bacterium]|nr:lysozyme inhibitor LprI family protein [Chthoniobacterales bacterium]
MKLPTSFAAGIVLLFMTVPFESKANEPEFKPPGTEENAAVDQANKRLDTLYKQLMGKLDADGQKALKEAERSWIKWRDDEAMLMARVGGAIGGSAMRVDFANAQKKLIDQRVELLSEYAKQVASK